MTNNKNPLGFPEMVDHVEKMLTDPEILRLYDEGDKLSSSQTKHDVGHAFSVLNTAHAQQMDLSWATSAVGGINKLKFAANGDVFALGSGSNGVQLQRYSASGTVLWTKTLSAPSLYGIDMDVDGSDNVLSLMPVPGQRGDTFFMDFAGRMVLRVTQQGNVVSYIHNASGSPAEPSASIFFTAMW